MVNPVAKAANAFLIILDALPPAVYNFMMLSALLFAIAVFIKLMNR